MHPQPVVVVLGSQPGIVIISNDSRRGSSIHETGADKIVFRQLESLDRLRQFEHVGSVEPLVVQPQIGADQRLRALIHQLHVGVYHVGRRIAEHIIGQRF